MPAVTLDLLGILMVEVGYINASVLTYYRAPDGNSGGFEDINVNTIEVPSEGKTREYRTIQAISGSFGTGSYAQRLFELLFGKSTIETGLPAGTASRQYYGDRSEEVSKEAAVRWTVAGKNTGTKLAQNARIEVPRANFNPYQPGNAENAPSTSIQTGINWASIKTTTDLNNVALPSVPSDGCFYFIDVLT